MPKYGIHHIVMKEAASKLSNTSNSAASYAAGLVNSQMPSALIGSIGPDLFFWGPDYDAVDSLYNLYKNIEEVVDLVNDIIEPIGNLIDKIGEPVDRLVETLAPNSIRLIRYALNEISETFSLFVSAVSMGLFRGVLSNVNYTMESAGFVSATQAFFQGFVPELQHNKSETDWYWFDMLHYRNTGDFARNLVENAVTDQQKAFAFGYLSHIATDVTGHPYVNQISGTTYRLNVQRHVMTENYQDTWKYAQYYNGESINHTLFDQLGLPEKLPTSIRDLLHDAFRSTYANAEHPELLPGDGFYSKEQIDKTYQVFYDILKLMKKMYVEPPEDPFFGVGDILADALDAFRKPPSAPDSGSSSCSWEDILAFGFTSSSRDCYDKFFNEVVTWMEYMGELMLWTLETIRNLIDLLLSILLSIPIGVLLAILYGIQLLTYKCYITSRVILSQSGFVTPEPSELDSSIARNLVTLFYPCARNFKNFPSVSAPMISHAVCPVETPENPSTAAGFYKGDITVTPDFFISVEPLRLKNLYSYSAASTPAQTRSVQDGGEGIGNAVDFAAWMITGANVPNIKENDKAALYNNWNLDADRGYGYKTWKGTVPGDSPWNVSNEEYI